MSDLPSGWSQSIGLWARLDRDDQVDHIRELEHYLLPESRLYGMAAQIRDADR